MILKVMRVQHAWILCGWFGRAVRKLSQRKFTAWIGLRRLISTMRKSRKSQEIIPQEHIDAWTKFSTAVENENVDQFSKIIGSKACILAVAFIQTNSIEKAEKTARSPARAGRAVLDCALHAIATYYGGKLSLYP